MTDNLDFSRFRKFIEEGYGVYEEGKTFLKRLEDEFVKKELVDSRSLELFLNRTCNKEISSNGSPIYFNVKKRYRMMKTKEKEVLPLWAYSIPSVYFDHDDAGFRMTESSR